MFVLGIIPARGGSKGIPDKNIYPLCGKPLIQYTVEAARQSNLDAFVLSTDSRRIQELSNCENTIIRPDTLAQADTPTLPVLLQVLGVYEEYEKVKVNAVMTLQPTSPLRTYEDINAAIKLFKEGGKDCLVSVVRESNLKKFYDAEGKPLAEQTAYNRHKDGDIFKRNGAIFITKVDLLLSGKIFDDRPVLYEMPKIMSIDIDIMDDIILAENIIKERTYGEA